MNLGAVMTECWKCPLRLSQRTWTFSKASDECNLQYVGKLKGKEMYRNLSSLKTRLDFVKTSGMKSGKILLLLLGKSWFYYKTTFKKKTLKLKLTFVFKFCF